MFSTVIQLVTVLTITFFLLLDGGRIANFVLAQVRSSHQERVRFIAADIYSATGGYVAGALTLATAAGISTYILLSILEVPFAVPLAVLMAFFDLIPLVGSTIGGVLVALVTLFADFPQDTIVWVVFVVVYQQFENSVLQPLVYRRAVNLHPLAVITAILIGSNLLGVLGALVAIPIAAALQIMLKDIWANRPSPSSTRRERRSRRPSGELPGSTAPGMPVFTLQKAQARVHVSPRIMKVACFFDQHSPMFGQPASSQTVTSLFSRTMSRVFAHSGEPGARTRIQSGFRRTGLSGRCAFSGWRGRALPSAGFQRIDQRDHDAPSICGRGSAAIRRSRCRRRRSRR